MTSLNLIDNTRVDNTFPCFQFDGQYVTGTVAFLRELVQVESFSVLKEFWNRIVCICCSVWFITTDVDRASFKFHELVLSKRFNNVFIEILPTHPLSSIATFAIAKKFSSLDYLMLINNTTPVTSSAIYG